MKPARLKKPIAKVALLLFCLSFFQGFFLARPKELHSSNLTSVSDTLSNNRLSFRGEVEGAHSSGVAEIALDTSPENGNNTSTGSGTLMINDGIRVGSGSTATITTVEAIPGDSRVFLAAALGANVADATPVVSTVSAVHTVRFTPPSQISGGVFRVLIPAAADAETGDGLPDKNGFDVTTGSLPTVTCTGGGSNFSFATGTATRSAVTIGSTNYHSFECQYGGSGASATAITMQIGTAAGNKLINPSPAGYSSSHAPGAGDKYTFRVRHLNGLDGSFAVVDESLGTVGVIEAVRVTATVTPNITFQITGVANGTSACGQTTDVATTPNTVPLSSVSSSSFVEAAQLLNVSTNAVGGYTVTASQSGNLTAYSLSGTPTISGFTGGNAITVVDWTATTTRGFGYSLAEANSSNAVTDTLEYNNGGASFNARWFGSTAEAIMTKATTADLNQAYVCYRLIVSGTQQAGDYENHVIYIATATF